MSSSLERIRGLTTKLDIVAALIGLLVGVVVAWMFPSQRDLGVAIIVACIFYLFFRTRIKTSGVFSLDLRDRPKQLLNVAFWVVFALSIWLYQTQPLYHRPLAYFLLISIAVGIIAVEILCFEENGGKRRVWSVLLKIILISISIRAGIFYEFPSLSGADAFWHARFTQAIVDTGFIPSFVEQTSLYAAYPVFHSSVAITQIVTSLALKNAIFLSVGLYHVISTVFIYFAGKKVAGTRVGLLAVLLLNINYALVSEGATNIITATMVTGWFILMLDLIIGDKVKSANLVILISLTAIIVMTHQLSTFVVMISIIAMFLAVAGASKLYRTPSLTNLSSTYILLFVIILLSYWMGMYPYQPIGVDFFGRLVGSVQSAFGTAELGYAAGVDRGVLFSIWDNTLFDLGYLLVLIPGICGIVWWVNSRNPLKLAIAIVAVVLFAIIYGTASLGLRTVIPGRWFPILSIFLSILASGYIVHVAQSFRPHLSRIAIFGFISLITFFMITTPAVNNDNPLYALARAGRTHFKASEVSGITTLYEVRSGTLEIDGYYGSGIVRQIAERRMARKEFTTLTVGHIDDGVKRESGNTTIVREALFEESTTYDVPIGEESGNTEYGRGIIDREFLEGFDIPSYNIIYRNGEVTAYQAR